MKRRFVVLLASFGVACSAPSAPPSSSPNPTAKPTAPTASTSAPTAESTASAPPKKLTNEDIFARLRSDMASCYEAGKKEVPTMTSGRVTFHASVDRSGRTTCAVPSDDSGLTQDVEDCMRKRLGRETYPAQDAPWSAALPLVVENGELSLGKPNATPMIDTIESHGLAEDLYDVVERMLPDLKGCVRGIGKSSARRVVYVGAEVGKDGKVTCALASSPSPVPESVRECAAATLAKATFKPPKRGAGLISIPLEVVSK